MATARCDGRAGQAQWHDLSLQSRRFRPTPLWRHGSSGLGGARTAVRCAASKREQQQATSNGSNGLDPSLELAVPPEQRPVNELTSLKQQALYSWGTLSLQEYVQKLAVVFGVVSTLVAGPIAFQTFDPLKQPLEFLLSAGTGSLVVVAAVVVRIYLGWAYVGERLLSAAVPYEETGWYDGQVFVKPPEVLTRDRLLGLYEVKPVLAKLRGTLVGSGVALLVCAVLLFGLIKAGADEDGMYGRSAAHAPRRITSEGLPVFSKNLRSLSQLAGDDQLAAEEAAAQKGVPGYCRDRYLRVAAGGQYCQQFDLR